MTDKCSVDECPDERYALGFCPYHYGRNWRYGTPNPTGIRRVVPGDFKTRLLARVQIAGPNECWPWTGYLFPNGYGGFSRDGKTGYAHRFTYEVLCGAIPAGMTLDHECHTPECKLVYDCPHRACCNPSHMKPKTQGDNMRRGNRHRK